MQQERSRSVIEAPRFSMPKNSSRHGSALVVVRTYRTLQDREERSESIAASWANTSALLSRCDGVCATMLTMPLRCGYVHEEVAAM